MRPTLCALALLLASPAALAGDLVVVPPGSGAPFTKVQTAVVAFDAPHGSLVRLDVHALDATGVASARRSPGGRGRPPTLRARS